ncbi:hypothetical protein D3C76_1216730 [compost metagenome]
MKMPSSDTLIASYGTSDALALKQARACSHVQLAVGIHQLLKGKGAISPTGIGQDPDRGIAKGFRLRPPCNVALGGQGAVRRLAEKCHETWRKPAYLLFEGRRGRDKFIGRQLIRPRRRSLDHRGQTTAIFEDGPVSFR